MRQLAVADEDASVSASNVALLHTNFLVAADNYLKSGGLARVAVPSRRLPGMVNPIFSHH
jgi:hypothetical protein